MQQCPQLVTEIWWGCPQLVTEILGGCQQLVTETASLSITRHWKCENLQTELEQNFQWQVIDSTAVLRQVVVVDSLAVSVISCGHPPTNSMRSCGHSHIFSVINCEEFEIKAKFLVEKELFNMSIVFLRHFYIIYVEIAFHVTVALNLLNKKN